jgi:hypothetical protein
MWNNNNPVSCSDPSGYMRQDMLDEMQAATDDNVAAQIGGAESYDVGSRAEQLSYRAHPSQTDPSFLQEIMEASVYLVMSADTDRVGHQINDPKLHTACGRGSKQLLKRLRNKYLPLPLLMERSKVITRLGKVYGLSEINQ